MNKLLILDKNPERYLAELQKKNLKDLEIYTATNPEQGKTHIEKAQIILARPDFIAPLLPDAKNLIWVQSTFAGVDALCNPGLRRDYLLTGVKNIFGPLMSEFVFAYILAIERQLFDVKANQLSKKWQELSYRSLTNLKIGIAGLGSIGMHVANTALHFGMQVSGFKRSPATIDNLERVYTQNEIDQFIPGLDYLVLALPDTPESRHIINKQRLLQMKKSAVIINVGRGASINQDDLVWALQNQELKGAILDVFEEEPLPESSPLWQMPNVHISPHIAATSFPKQITEIFYTNYQRFTSQKALNFLIDFERGY